MAKRSTVVSRANTTSESLKTTVPSYAVKHLDLHDGDEVRWYPEQRQGEKILVIKKIKD